MSHGADHSGGHDHGSHGHGHGGHGHDMHGSHMGHHSPSEHYGAHALVFFGGHGFTGSGGHVINTVSTAGAHYGTAGHIDGIGANQLNTKNVRLTDAQGVNLLVAHALGLVDHGVGAYGYMLDQVAREVGLMRIDSRPNIKGEDTLGLDGILPWNAWGDMKSTEGPNGWLPMINGMTDRIIHAYAIPHMGKLNGRRQLHVSSDCKVFVLARMTVWHYSETKDAEVKIEFIINHGYVFDRWHELYTFNGTQTSALEAKAFDFVKRSFARLTAAGEEANPAPRQRYLDQVRKLPGWQNVGRDSRHETGVHVGTPAERAEVQAEDVRDIKQEDRTIENTVASGASGTTPPPQTPAEGFDDGENPDGDSMDGPIAVPDQAVAPSPAAAPAIAPADTTVTGEFVIPGNLKQ